MLLWPQWKGLTSNSLYACISVYQQGSCAAPESAVPLSSGALSSNVADTRGCGSMTSPWSIKMAAGQKVTLTLTDYSWSSNTDGSECRPYAYISEKSVGVNQTICGGSERERHLYTSTSDHVVIQTAPANVRNAAFLIRYSGMYVKVLDDLAKGLKQEENIQTIFVLVEMLISQFLRKSVHHIETVDHIEIVYRFLSPNTYKMHCFNGYS